MDNIKQRQERITQLVSEVLAEAARMGASAAEVAASSSNGLAVNVRLGEVETIEHTSDNGLGISVYFGHKKGSASTADLSAESLAETLRQAVDIARYTSEDSCNGLADAQLMARQPLPDLDLYHPWELSVEQAIAIATETEDTARRFDPRIGNSEGASINTGSGFTLYGNSHGFIGGYASTRHGLSCSMIAQQGDEMQRDYWWTSARRHGDLEDAAAVGRQASERALARLGSRKLSTCQAPVIFQADVASGLLGHLIGAIRGSSLYRKSSFLLDQLGEQIFPDFVTIGERPLLPGALGSAAFDGEGVATRDRDLVRDGILQSYVLDSYSARKLGMETTGNAGGVHNLRIDCGELDRAGLLREMGSGLLVTELMGQGINMVTGDYSRGASGFWVERGEIQYPVEEITVAGNLKEMFRKLRAVGADIDRRGSTWTGSWLLDTMTIAGD
jgi:PmbA protein